MFTILKINYSYTDEFGQESMLQKTFTDIVLEHCSALELLADEFKLFLLSAGFSRDEVDRIIIEE